MIKLKINGQAHQFDGDPDMPLLWHLRDDMQLTGTKFGCGIGQCGACTVIRDGRAIRSCQTLLRNAESANITTIEGLSAAGDHPVQKAWKQANVPQCGYCQSGQMMSAAALLGQKPKPTSAEIESAMQGNICRCGTYQRIHQAVKLAASGGKA